METTSSINAKFEINVKQRKISCILIIGLWKRKILIFILSKFDFQVRYVITCYVF